jgi:hypothetical protein
MRPHPVLLSLLVLAGCAQPEPDAAAVLAEALAAHQSSLAGVGAPPPAAAAPRGPTRPGAIAAIPNGANELLGQTPEALLGILGEPRLRRSEGAAEIWHYQAPQCHLDIVLYREGGAAGLRVAFAQARAVGTARRGEAACLRDIARGASRPMPPAFPGAVSMGA